MSIIFQDRLIPIPLILGERKRIEKRPSNVDSSILISGRRMLILRFWFLGQEMFIASSTVRWTATIAIYFTFYVQFMFTSACTRP